MSAPVFDLSDMPVDLPGEDLSGLPADFVQMLRHQAEVRAYVNANLRPIVGVFNYNFCHCIQNEMRWRQYDMLFTAFLIGNARVLYTHVDGGDALYMEHLRAWYEALNHVVEDLHIPPRVRDAERILAELVAGRKAALAAGTVRPTPFDALLVERDDHCHKPYTLFCLCLTYIVQSDCRKLRKQMMEWYNTVTCGWFDNTEDAGAFVARAEYFLLQKLSGCILMEYAQKRVFLNSS